MYVVVPLLELPLVLGVDILTVDRIIGDNESSGGVVLTMLLIVMGNSLIHSLDVDEACVVSVVERIVDCEVDLIVDSVVNCEVDLIVDSVVDCEVDLIVDSVVDVVGNKVNG